eukprot:sb/3471716/
MTSHDGSRDHHLMTSPSDAGSRDILTSQDQEQSVLDLDNPSKALLGSLQVIGALKGHHQPPPPQTLPNHAAAVVSPENHVLSPENHVLSPENHVQISPENHVRTSPELEQHHMSHGTPLSQGNSPERGYKGEVQGPEQDIENCDPSLENTSQDQRPIIDVKTEEDVLENRGENIKPKET